MPEKTIPDENHRVFCLTNTETTTKEKCLLSFQCHEDKIFREQDLNISFSDMIFQIFYISSFLSTNHASQLRGTGGKDQESRSLIFVF